MKTKKIGMKIGSKVRLLPSRPDQRAEDCRKGKVIGISKDSVNVRFDDGEELWCLFSEVETV